MSRKEGRQERQSIRFILGRVKFQLVAERVSGKFSALLTEPIEISTERFVREVLLPEPRREEMNLTGGMGIDALEHIDEVDVGVNALQSARGNQALHDAHILRADLRPAEQPVPSSSAIARIARSR